ncbi:hypothetical protein AM571_CH02598 [Rhizobium etli 8C-3]|uniref:Uncharacterized protein n=1 Tax=Rhizobium etli 8C-3 TaxID=538025 RepID=A0A1L5P5G5_RHIET|nr:hypothetical protein AM571_CH02598 [Rhizobium etli 8C-3]
MQVFACSLPNAWMRQGKRPVKQRIYEKCSARAGKARKMARRAHLIVSGPCLPFETRCGKSEEAITACPKAPIRVRSFALQAARQLPNCEKCFQSYDQSPPCNGYDYLIKVFSYCDARNFDVLLGKTVECCWQRCG